ncbi:hypothetical protein [Ruegeria arenilitoris]|uniref:hypothetical protein n=1 Tax=Ruegeria arenilitoris TaxID=1173585 RepID=UPI00147BC860|nr:hypothetical protein [Ruegeria arenilitoris]
MGDAVQALWEQLVELDQKISDISDFALQPFGEDSAAQKIAAIFDNGLTKVQAEEVVHVMVRLQAVVSALKKSGMGECQMDTPYAPLRPIGRPDGTLKWCCTHPTQHCF